MMKTVRAEMSANVWKVLKKSGEEVAADEEIMILESMKMEIPVFSEAAGTIYQIFVEEGQTVAEGDALVTVS